MIVSQAAHSGANPRILVPVKTLLVLRHAKSSWDNPGASDRERPLNKRGRKAASRMGALLAHKEIVPDVVLSSTAERTRETVARALEAADADPEVRFLDELYLAQALTYLEVLADLDAQVETAMVVGHNPGLEELVSGLAAKHIRYPTAALSVIRLQIDAWHQAPLVTPQTAHVEQVWLPRELM